MKRLLLLLPLLCLLALPAPATAEPASPEAILRLLKLSGTMDAIVPVMNQLLKKSQQDIRKRMPNLPEDAYKAINEELRAETGQIFKELLANKAAYYAGHLTQAEVEELIAFYDSPVWRKQYQVNKAYVSQELRPLLRRIGPKLSQQIRKRVHDRLVRDGYIRKGQEAG